MDIKNSDMIKIIKDLKVQISKKDIMLKDKTWQLQRIYSMRAWKILTLLVRVKRQNVIFFKKILKFFILSGLCMVTLIITIYLSVLKLWRKTVIFPGG